MIPHPAHMENISLFTLRQLWDNALDTLKQGKTDTGKLQQGTGKLQQGTVQEKVLINA